MERNRKQDRLRANLRDLFTMLKWVGLLALLVGCNLAIGTTPTPITTRNAQLQPTPFNVAVTPEGDGWQTVAPGLERRTFEPGGFLAQIIALRIDPNLYTFRAHYQPGEARGLNEWANALPEAVALVNANFFERDNTILGLLVSDGAISGETYRNRGGMFAVQDGLPRLRSLIHEPYQGETLSQAVQAFPMLVVNGQAVNHPGWSSRPSRRTVIAQDNLGRVLLMATPGFGLSLGELSRYLAQTELNLVSALNLDGGGSTMLLNRPANERITSLDAVPAVLAVYAR